MGCDIPKSQFDCIYKVQILYGIVSYKTVGKEFFFNFLFLCNDSYYTDL